LGDAKTAIHQALAEGATDTLVPMVMGGIVGYVIRDKGILNKVNTSITAPTATPAPVAAPANAPATAPAATPAQQKK
jgi:hypothetical protein